ncbi:MAG TPA: DUF6502 family protein [Steroidobacteraceae bacterium]|nr:DUF6502 family protein [Steroidobacteraceae bacterium]
MSRTAAPNKSRVNDPLRDETLVALQRIIDPIVNLMFETGVTVREFSHLLRERAVRATANRVSKESGRKSKSQIAIITGLSRSEVARILKSNDESARKRLGQHPARRVLAAWFESPRFLKANGDPAVLPIFGKRKSFEQLVALHSGGIPVRAMLDELTRIDALEMLPDQKVKAKSRVPILTGLTGGAISLIGERTRDLLDTLISNLRCNSKPFFEGTALLDESDPKSVSLIRKEISEQGANFIDSANALFGRSRHRISRPDLGSNAKCRLGVTVYYFQDSIEPTATPTIKTNFGRRRNLQRQSRRTSKKLKRNSVDRSVITDRS